MNDGAPAAAPAAPASAPAAPAAAPAGDWTSSIPAEHKGYLETKGWKTPADLLTSYKNLEGLRGVPAERLLTLPGDDKPESWAPVYDRLGRPKTVDEYQLPVPEGDNGEFAKTASGWFHENGISKKQAQALAAKWNDFAKQSVEKSTAEYHAKIAQEGEALKGEWKGDYDKNVAQAQEAVKKLGVSKEIVDAIESKMGFAATIKFMHSLGAKLGEHGFHGANPAGGAGGFSGGMTTEAAKAQITQLRSDGDFMRRFAEGEAAALAKWRQLHQAAFPEQAA